MVKRSRVLGLVLAALLPAAAATVAPVAAATPPVAGSRAAGGDKCVMDAFGHTADGRISFRRVVNARVTVARSTARPVRWRPISWGLVMVDAGGQETTRQVVASTDGRVRLVETRWGSGRELDVRVVKVLGRGFPRRLIAFDDSSLFWLAADHSLHRAAYSWSKERLSRPRTLPVSIVGARTLSVQQTDAGTRIYYTTGAGALHAVAVAGARSSDTVLRASGYGGVTGLRTGPCLSPNYARMRSYVGLLSVNRTTGVGRFQRILHPGRNDGGTVTRSARVRPSGWTWRRLG